VWAASGAHDHRRTGLRTAREGPWVTFIALPMAKLVLLPLPAEPRALPMGPPVRPTPSPSCR
jgi:hypothetical protein